MRPFLFRLTIPDGRFTYAEAEAYVKKLDRDARDTQFWRLPTLSELMSIVAPPVEFDSDAATTDEYKLSTPLDYFWTCTDSPYDPNCKMVVNFRTGRPLSCNKYQTALVRCMYNEERR